MKSIFLPGLISPVNGSSGGNCTAEVNVSSVDKRFGTWVILKYYMLLSSFQKVLKSFAGTTLHWISWSPLLSEYRSAHGYSL